MSEYKVYWLKGFPLIRLIVRHVPRNNYGDLSKKQRNKYKEKLVILQSIEIIFVKRKETREVTYTCRYSRGYLIPIIQSCQDELRIKRPLEYLQV